MKSGAGFLEHRLFQNRLIKNLRDALNLIDNDPVLKVLGNKLFQTLRIG